MCQTLAYLPRMKRVFHFFFLRLLLLLFIHILHSYCTTYTLHTHSVVHFTYCSCRLLFTTQFVWRCCCWVVWNLAFCDKYAAIEGIKWKSPRATGSEIGRNVATQEAKWDDDDDEGEEGEKLVTHKLCIFRCVWAVHALSVHSFHPPTHRSLHQLQCTRVECNAPI